jgi:EmrB/QacA subfamily drug resistance transporter
MSAPSRSSIIVPLIVACALFMEQLDSSIIATALPSIAHSLDTSPLHLNLAITSYMFSLAIFIPLSGWVADRFGARSVFRAAIVVFVIGSALCGVSQNLGELVGARIIQGMGGAMMVPVGRLVMLRTVPRTELVNAMAWLTTPALIGPVMGPPLGGLIVTYAHWRWIFFVNLPIGVLGLVLASIFIPNVREKTKEPLDLRGFLLMAVALSGLVFGFETAGRNLVSNELVIGLLAAGVLGLVLYLWHIRGITHPIIDLSLARYKTYRASIIGGSLFRTGIGALPFLLPLMLQVGFGVSPVTSGLLTFASAAGAILMKMSAAPIIRRFGFRPILVTNTLINAVFLMGCALFTPHTWHAAIFAFLLFGGFFRSLQFTALNTFAYAEIPQEFISRANTLYSMLQQLTLSLGVAVGALLLNITLAIKGDPHLGPWDFWPAYIGIGILSLSALISFVTLSPDAGAELSGHVTPVVATPAAAPTPVAPVRHQDPA